MKKPAHSFPRLRNQDARLILVLLQMGFSYTDALGLPEDEATVFCEAYAALKSSTTETYKVSRPKRKNSCPKQ